jgi:GTP-binding protein YchF
MVSMSLSIGIVGLPNVGKSTLFNALTKKSVLVANYPFATIDPSVGVVAVPDERLGKLAEFSKSARVIPAAVEFVDIAGLVKGASTGEGLGNKFLSNIRETDAIVEVVRIFEDDDIIHVNRADNNTINPRNDIDVINLELILADLETVSKRLANLGKEVKAGKKEAILEKKLMEKLTAVLTAGKLVSSLTSSATSATATSAGVVVIDEMEKPFLKSLHLLTAKPIMYVLNKKAGGKNLDEKKSDDTDAVADLRYTELLQFFSETGAAWVVVDAGIEQELKDIDANEKEELRHGLGADDDGIDLLIKKGYELLNLMTYFTTGPDETRGWTIPRGSTAPTAGTAIHGDFKEKFIRAEVIEWDKLLAAGSYAVARERGLVRTEGKEYIVKDGDVIEFKI